ncbi:MAG TPA: hypothetical protein K8V56_18745, partial [Sporosarcina psychrophila]|nr:hypothetical protein [Sporosarcina psychrophila]
MIPIDGQQKKKVAIHISRSDGKGTYPARRAAMIANALADEIDIVYLCGADSPPAPEGFKTMPTPTNALFLQALTTLKPDLLLRDSGSTIQEEI